MGKFILYAAATYILLGITAVILAAYEGTKEGLASNAGKLETALRIMVAIIIAPVCVIYAVLAKATGVVLSKLQALWSVIRAMYRYEVTTYP